MLSLQLVPPLHANWSLYRTRSSDDVALSPAIPQGSKEVEQLVD